MDPVPASDRWLSTRARRSAVWATAALSTALLLGCGGADSSMAQGPHASGGEEEEERSGLRQAAVPQVGDEDSGGMEVEGVRGRLTPYQIQMGIRPHQGELSRCYADHAEHAYVGGRIAFDFDVSREGAVKNPTITESLLGAWGVEFCLLEVVSRMTFDPPEGGEARVNLPLDFDARSPAATWHEVRAARELAAPPAEPPPDEEDAGRRRAQNKRRARARADAGEDEPATKREDLERCREEAEAGPPSGLSITVYITRAGRVTSAGFSAPSEIDPAWAECAGERMTSWRMSAPETPGVSVAKLSFSFP